MGQGFVLNWRKIEEWEWYTTPHMAHLFQHLIRRANHEPKKWRGKLIERGQVVTGRKSLSLQTGISEQTIRTCIERLKSTGEITIQSTSMYSIVTLCKYSTYQDKPTAINQANSQEPNQRLTNNQPATNQRLTTNNNDNNVTMTNNSNSVRFDSEKRIITGLNQEDYDQWKEAFPAVEIEAEIRSATQWLLDNPTKRKKQVRRFLTNWLRRRQERGGSTASKPGTIHLLPIPGKVCSKDACGMPAVYKSSGGSYDYYYCQEHMPAKVKEKYA